MQSASARPRHERWLRSMLDNPGASCTGAQEAFPASEETCTSSAAATCRSGPSRIRRSAVGSLVRRRHFAGRALRQAAFLPVLQLPVRPARPIPGRNALRPLQAPETLLKQLPPVLSHELFRPWGGFFPSWGCRFERSCTSGAGTDHFLAGFFSDFPGGLGFLFLPAPSILASRPLSERVFFRIVSAKLASISR